MFFTNLFSASWVNVGVILYMHSHNDLFALGFCKNDFIIFSRVLCAPSIVLMERNDINPSFL